MDGAYRDDHNSTVIRRIDIPPNAVVLIHETDRWFSLDYRCPPTRPELRTSGVIYDDVVVSAIIEAVAAANWNEVFSIAATHTNFFHLDQWKLSGLNSNLPGRTQPAQPARPVRYKRKRKRQIGDWMTFDEMTRGIRELSGMMIVYLEPPFLVTAEVLAHRLNARDKTQYRILKSDRGVLRDAIERMAVHREEVLQRTARAIEAAHAARPQELRRVARDLSLIGTTFAHETVLPVLPMLTLTDYDHGHGHWPDILPERPLRFLDGDVVRSLQVRE